MKPGEIPISDAADIAKKRKCAYVIVFGVREDGEKFHVSSWGKDRRLCKVAGAVADKFAEAVLNGRVRPPETEPPDKLDRLKEIASIIEHVDNRCMASDGPVTKTLSEMTQAEISRIYELAKGKS